MFTVAGICWFCVLNNHSITHHYCLSCQTSLEMSKIRRELNEKFSEIGRLQMELDARGRKDANDDAQSLKRAIATLEKENNNLKVKTFVHCLIFIEYGEVSCFLYF